MPPRAPLPTALLLLAPACAQASFNQCSSLATVGHLVAAFVIGVVAGVVPLLAETFIRRKPARPAFAAAIVVAAIIGAAPWTLLPEGVRGVGSILLVIPFGVAVVVIRKRLPGAAAWLALACIAVGWWQGVHFFTSPPN